MRRCWRVALAVCASALGMAAAQAQTYPTRPVRLVVPFPPGGSTDILARALGQKLGEAWNQPFVIENRAGAGGTIGAESVARASPDGYTLLMGHIGTLAVAVSLYPKLPYSPTRDFSAVALMAIVPNVLVVQPSLPVTSVAQLVAYARANPGKLTYSSGGSGSAAHIAMEYFKLQTRTDIVHVPYKGTAQSVTDVIGGQVSLTMTGAPAVMPQVRAGKLRALGVSSPARVDALPDIPPIAETGIPGFDATQWYGIVAPAGTPREIVTKLNAEIRRTMDTREMRERLNGEGALAAADTPEQFAALIRNEIERWAVVVKAAQMRPD